MTCLHRRFPSGKQSDCAAAGRAAQPAVGAAVSFLCPREDLQRQEARCSVVVVGFVAAVSFLVVVNEINNNRNH